ncbi:hypothetical protein QBC44DRAFT_304133 [Cladorrhinum sp. PSN332]|nr:hypothetical protein QBC44DRAFT_304133 [Cladorrhinum sp. PSN332]
MASKAFVYLFEAQPSTPYIFVHTLTGLGTQSIVQLVANIHTRQVAIRKVSRHARTKQLQVAATTYLHPYLPNCRDLQPRFVTCLSPDSNSKNTTYWALYNGGSFATWNSTGLPINLIIRCIRQVCETLEFMYQRCPKVIYHRDLHLGNIFLHFGEENNNSDAPHNFYVGDFGSAQVGGRRRRWDVSRFAQAIGLFLTRYSDAASENLGAVKDMMRVLNALEESEGELVVNPLTRPPSLAAVIARGRSYEPVVREREQISPALQHSLALRRAGAREVPVSGRKPFVYRLESVPTTEEAAAEFGQCNIEGPWSLVEWSWK